MTNESRLRQGGRALGRILGFIVIGSLIVAVLELLAVPLVGMPDGERAMTALDSVATAVGLLIATALVLRGIDKRPWSDVWMGRAAARPSVLALGFAIGALTIAVPTAFLIIAHWLGSAPAVRGSWIGAAARISAVLAPAALFEELLMRGYILAVLRELWGWRVAVVTTSVVFGALHLRNPGATLQSLSLVTLAGFFLAAVLYATKSLYAAWMAHFAWNWIMAAVFHVAVSGLPLETPNYRYVDAGPDWATGGQWGPEGGIPAGIGMIAGLAFLYARRPSPIAGGNDEPDQPMES